MGREYPVHPLVGVSALVLKDGKVLLVKRGMEPGKGLWSLPGGLVEVGERLEEAVLRELKEETGVDGEVKGLFDVEEYIERDERGRVKYHYILLVFLVEPKGGVVRPASDVLDAKYATVSDALKTPLTRTTRRVLEKLSSAGHLD